MRACILATMALFLALVLPGVSSAVDGVIEINQTRALAGSITPSDTPGFPVTIDSPGSYRLTGVGTSAYTGNNINGNTAGTTNGLVEFGQNVCDGDTTCP